MSTPKRALLFGIVLVTVLAACSSDDEARQLATQLCEHRSTCEDETGRTYDQVPGIGGADCIDTVEVELQESIDDEGVICRFAFEQWMHCQQGQDCRDFLLPGLCSEQGEGLQSACPNLADDLVSPRDHFVDVFCNYAHECRTLTISDVARAHCTHNVSEELDALTESDSDCLPVTLRVMDCLSNLHCSADLYDQCGTEITDQRATCGDLATFAEPIEPHH